jgi:hypothetical protein
MHYREVVGKLLMSRDSIRARVRQPKVVMRADNYSDDASMVFKTNQDYEIDRIETVDDEIVLFVSNVIKDD